MGKNARERGSRRAARIAERRAEGLAVASARNIHMSALKVRRVIALIRGKGYREAVDILNFTPKIASEPIRKVVESAAANAENNLGLDADRLFVKGCHVDEGITVKRIHPTTMGRVRNVKRRTSHITVQLAEHTRVRASRAGGDA